jgi:hypothetical protein
LYDTPAQITRRQCRRFSRKGALSRRQAGSVGARRERVHPEFAGDADEIVPARGAAGAVIASRGSTVDGD